MVLGSNFEYLRFRPPTTSNTHSAKTDIRSRKKTYKVFDLGKNSLLSFLNILFSSSLSNIVKVRTSEGILRT
jgi:hypothetical protein